MTPADVPPAGPRPGRLGQLLAVFRIYCATVGCPSVRTLDAERAEDAAWEAHKLGWRVVGDRGWHCPRCAAKRGRDRP